MSRQMFLFSDAEPQASDSSTDPSELRLTLWNVQNPSESRARLQVEWLSSTASDVVVLTEASRAAGSLFLVSSLEAQGFSIAFKEPQGRDFATIVAVRGATARPLARPHGGHMGERIAAMEVESSAGTFAVVGLYALAVSPYETVERERVRTQFQRSTRELVATVQRAHPDRLIVGGDLNVLQPGHIPHVSAFGPSDFGFYNSFIELGLRDALETATPGVQEHTWFGRDGSRQRLDHVFLSPSLSARLKNCSVDHAPRERALSDHSALRLAINAQSSATVATNTSR